MTKNKKRTALITSVASWKAIVESLLEKEFMAISTVKIINTIGGKVK
ncbi:hypothetical protein ACN077_09010 [Clostridium chromiireducens]